MGQRLRQLLCAAIVAAAAAPCPAQSRDLREQIQAALTDARPALESHLKQALRSATRPGELALLVLAALHDGMPVSNETLERAIQRLAKARPHKTYDIALRLLVLEACPSFPDRMKLAKADLKSLLAHRSDEGAFQYTKNPTTWDLSNTQYGALGLRAAWSLGLKVRKDIWSKLAREIGEQQAPDGGFCYTRKRSGWDPYPSMTVAGIAVLAICRQALGDSYGRRDQIDKQIERAWQWLDQHRDTIGSPKEKWSFYYHYGLERAAILCDVVKIQGRTDWYEKGAQMFVEQQLAGGGWQSMKDKHPGQHLSDKRGDSVPTSFAILFLRRKFQKDIGPITERVVRLVNIGPRSRQRDVDECARQLVAQGKTSMPDVIKAMRSDIVPQRQVAAKALKAITGDAFGFDPGKDRDANRGAVRQAELWFLKNR
ncbi:MAG: hypothetical protein ACE37K_18095 [Planctomycetota bacterium]